MTEWKWDTWQQEVLDHTGNITLRTGRQVGKSVVIGEKAVKFALENPGTTTMIIAASQRQSSLLFEKVRANVDHLCDQLKGDKSLYKEVPTLTRIIFTNGSRIYAMPAGKTGAYIRGFTIDLLIADEAAYIPEIVWTAVLPMLVVSRQERGFGYIIMLSTPYGKGGYFYDSFTDNDFRSWHISSEKCKRISLDFLKKERLRMTKAEYKQEYMGDFIDEWNQFFPTDLIKSRMTFIEWSKEKDFNPNYKYYMGVDIARYGGDENAFVICELRKKHLKIVKTFTTDRVSTTDTIRRVVEYDRIYNFRKIFIDDGGVGGAVTDSLQDKLGRKVLGLNNASKRVEIQGEERKKGILKEDLYSNTLMLMETGMIDIISDLDLLRSLKGITHEYSGDRVKIWGHYSHLTEALVRACWCIKEKGLDLYIA